MPEKWLTYEELAAAFGIGKESARTLVKRKRWSRKMGNDGLARIGVPEELIEARIVPQGDPPSDPQNAPQHDPGIVPRADPPIMDPAVPVLTRHIERLESQLDEALKRAADRDHIAAQRDLASSQVEALRSMLEVEKQRVDEWKAVADRFATQAEKLTAVAEARRSWWPWRRSA